ncbi:MMPL family transporter [Actinobacteria bacterium YIM 96077]|uniref:MMPL domain-containing protein n=1 Tax=Phytoactinopolyspora halophila TaxID=1981511 RepID=A0A329QNU7_9ACTN|nr:MMPL family transporter [Phytoactinopolyspora halophila]AYY15292.1 MMPL family transporter [Actinobacteria bacterium YIM 96077]RAW13836.1 MMPL domain-containing protein [Phytoactinopolyspora halophila]
MFARWGARATRLRWRILPAVVVIAVVGGGYGIGVFDATTQGGYEDPGSEAVQARQVMQSAPETAAADVIAVYTAPAGQRADSDEFAATVQESLSALPDASVSNLTTYWDAGAPYLLSDDGRSALALVTLAGEDSSDTQAAFDEVKDALHVDDDGVQTTLTGTAPVQSAISDQTKQDLFFAEGVALPVVAFLLIIIFGGVVAALLPVLIGALTVPVALGILRLIAEFTTVNEFAINVAGLLGLGMAIDYGLFIVSRYREERASGALVDDAIRNTVATAGRTVAFSALLLIVALSTLLLFPQDFLGSLAYGGMTAVALAAIVALTALPAILRVLGDRIDAWRIRLFRHRSPEDAVARTATFWGRLADRVMHRPLLFAAPILAILVLLISPFLDTTFGSPDERVLPEDDPARIATEDLNQRFPEIGRDDIQIVLYPEGDAPRDASGVDDTTAARFADDVSALPEVEAVDRTSPPDASIVVLEARFPGAVTDRPAEDAVDAIRSLEPPDGVEVLVGGVTALNVDSLDAITDRLPLMTAILVGATLVLLFLAFGSIVLPLKAAVMAAVSLSATFGVLTWIFVEGHGAGLLDVTPQPMEIGVVVLMAAVIFGLSTDYEVFLLSRIVEAHEAGASTATAVRTGMIKSGRVITSAALLLIVVTGAFALSGIQMMRFIGIGMMFALALDATVIRMLLVPSVLKLMGRVNWWAPGPLRTLRRRLALDHTPTR